MQIKFDKILGMLRESDISSSSGYHSVTNFASLLAASSVSGQTYLVQNATGIWPVNFKQKGLYRSDGTSWNYLGIEYDTTSLKVGATTVTNSPVELTASGLVTLTPDNGNGRVNIDASLSGHNISELTNNVGYITSSAITNKYDSSNFVAGTNYLTPAGNGSNLTNLTKSQVNLGNVDNTSDLNKPLSTAQQSALDLKQNALSSQQLSSIQFNTLNNI